MEENKFSVLMSIYIKENAEFFDKSLESILDTQTIKPTELVLVKDGPLTKELDKVINKYLKKYPKIIKVFSLKENQGLGKALQYGLLQCKYDLVMRMDSDDISLPDRFKKELEFMNNNPDISVVGGYIEEFEENINEEKRLKIMPITYEDELKYARFRNPLNHVTVCFRKKDVLEVGNYQPLDYLEDHYLWSRLLVNKKKIANIPEVLVYVRIGNGFNKRRGNKKYIKGWKFLQNYLYENKFINFFEKCRNLLGMYTIVYVPPFVRDFLYKNILRKKN